MFDAKKVKKDFPIFSKTFNGNKLVYLDNAATTQKPQVVIDSLVEFYSGNNANISRSSHFLSDLSTDLYEAARNTVAKFINASAKEVIFTKNSTESLNIVAFGWGLSNLSDQDVILTTTGEHNSSVLPWKAVTRAVGCTLEYLELDAEGNLESGWESKLNSRVKIVAITHASNVMGTVLPLKEICKRAKDFGAKVVVDGSQAISHNNVDVKTLGCDFYVFSGHKIMAPMGVGVLWGTEEALNEINPISYGGGMVKDFGIEKDNLLNLPFRLESGTPNGGGVYALGEALKYLEGLGLDEVHSHVHNLTQVAYDLLKDIPGINILGPKGAKDRAGLISFYFDDIHSHDISAVLSSKGIAVRSGLHCAMNLYKTMNLPSSTRASFYLYNTMEDVEDLVSGVKYACEMLKND